MNSSLDRRAFLRRTSAAAAGLILTSGCATTGGTGAVSPPARRVRPLVPVRVAPERVTRTLAGLRPYRPSGFVVRAQRFGDRTVIHNYGHGGGGISLAWGSSELAAELAGEFAAETGERRFAVLGCGIMGLTTARLLQDRGFQVTLYAKDLPPHTTSNIGGGQWSPFTVSQAGETTPEFDRQFERAARLAHARYQLMVGPRYGVRWIENYSLRYQSRAGGRGGPIGDLFYQEEEFGPGEHPFDAPYVGVFTTMLIEPNLFLPAVTDDVLLRGGRIEVRAFNGLEEVLSLEERGIVNCTGLGSRALFGDEGILPLKGQLVVLLPQPEVDYILLGGSSYMFPRSDGIILGGSQERDDWTTTNTPEVVERILEGNRMAFQGMRPGGPF
jgi:D-amino-acid oxidase